MWGTYIYLTATCPRTPDPATGHILRWVIRSGTAVYMTWNEEAAIFALGGASVLLIGAGVMLGEVWGISTRDAIGLWYEKLRKDVR
jgi:hypothetical protein